MNNFEHNRLINEVAFLNGQLEKARKELHEKEEEIKTLKAAQKSARVTQIWESYRQRVAPRSG